MLLTLSARSFVGRFAEGFELFDLPAFASGELGVKGLTLHASLLRGWDAKKLDKLRDLADKAHCPCLLLVNDEPLDLVSDDDNGPPAGSLDRLSRVISAAHRLGCPCVGFSLISSPNDEDGRDMVSERIRSLMVRAERVEVSLLVQPDPSGEGLSGAHESLTQLIRKVGGFRVGSLPDLGASLAVPDTDAYLKAVVPYASAMMLPVNQFDLTEFGGADATPLFDVVRAVGFAGNLALEWMDATDPAKPLLQAREAVETALAEEAGA